MNFGNFAGNLARKARENINASSSGGFIAKLGEVVAPVLDDEEYESGSEYTDEEDDEEYYEEEDGEYYEEEGEYAQGEYEEEEYEFEGGSNGDHVHEVDDDKELMEVGDETKEKSGEDGGGWSFDGSDELEESGEDDGEGRVRSVVVPLFNDDEYDVSQQEEDVDVSMDAIRSSFATDISLPEDEEKIDPEHETDVSTDAVGSSFATELTLPENEDEMHVLDESVLNNQDSSSVLEDDHSAALHALDNSEWTDPAPEITPPQSSKSPPADEAPSDNQIASEPTSHEVHENQQQRQLEETTDASLLSSQQNHSESAAMNESEEQPRTEPIDDDDRQREAVPESDGSHHLQSIDDAVSGDKPNQLTAPSKDLPPTTNQTPPQPSPPPQDDNSLLIASLQTQLQALTRQLSQTQQSHATSQTKLKRLLSSSASRNTALESQYKSLQSQHQAETSRQQRALEVELQKTKQLTRFAEEKQKEVEQLKGIIGDMRKMVSEGKEKVRGGSMEVRELKGQKEELEGMVQTLQQKVDVRDDKLKRLQEENGKLGGIQMEYQMLKEARDRDRLTSQSLAESASTTQSQLVSERDAARAEARDVSQRLQTTQADYDILKADYERVLMSNGNLQEALESFQREKEAQTELMEEQIRSREMAREKAHRVEMEAVREESDKKVKEVQIAADHAVKNKMEEVRLLENQLQQLQKDNINLRRSLDEAIHRLQLSQEDVIDRTLMKNILLDWNSKHGHEQKQVLEIMASVLHFTTDEKAQFGIGDGLPKGGGAFDKMVGVVAAPLPQPRLNVDKIEGENVREKWVNFLLAETGGDEDETSEKRRNGNDHLRKVPSVL